MAETSIIVAVGIARNCGSFVITYNGNFLTLPKYLVAKCALCP